MKTLLSIAITLIVTPLTAEARFHDGSFANCGGCHNERKTQEVTATDVCLHCHTEVVPVFTRDGSGITPGGDFYWLGKTFGDDPDRHGHNLVVYRHNLRDDRSVSEAPGGTYRSQFMGCTSCHDPHAKEGQYRLLGTVGYKGGIDNGNFEFRHPAPIVGSPEEVLFRGESDLVHNDYVSGMSEWCTNCHETLVSQHQHPAGMNARLGRLSDTYVARAPGSYDWLVPIEAAPARRPGDTSNVMCLTCHRAHASPFGSIGRWDFKVAFLRDSPALAAERSKIYAGIDPLVRYGAHQRSLCQTCH